MIETNSPRVSVVINCFNGASTLERAVQSVLSQSFQDFEILIFDNQSSDNSRKIAMGFADPRIRLICAISHTNLSVARNLAVKECRGRLVAFLDVDDVWFEDKLFHQVRAWADSFAEVIGTNHSRSGIRPSKSVNGISSHRTANQFRLAANYYVPMSSLLFDLEFLRRNNLNFRESTHIIGDFALVLDSLERGAKLQYLDEPLVQIYVHKNSESSKGLSLMVRELEEYALSCNRLKLRSFVLLRSFEILMLHFGLRSVMRKFLILISSGELGVNHLFDYVWTRILFKVIKLV